VAAVLLVTAGEWFSTLLARFNGVFCGGIVGGKPPGCLLGGKALLPGGREAAIRRLLDYLPTVPRLQK